MNYEVFTSMIHPNLMAEFTKEHYKDETDPATGNTISYTYEEAVKGAYQVAYDEYYELERKLATHNVEPKFSSDTYILKKGFIIVYNWILHNKAFLSNLNLTSLGIQDSDIFNHFLSLKNAEEKELQQLRDEAMEEYMEEKKGGSSGVFIRHMPIKDAYGRNIGTYRRY